VRIDLPGRDTSARFGGAGARTFHPRLASPHLRANVWWWCGSIGGVVGARRRRPVSCDSSGGEVVARAGGFELERPVLVHLPLGLGPRRRATVIEHHGLLHPDGAAVGGVDGPGRARGLPVPRRRRPAGPPAPAAGRSRTTAPPHRHRRRRRTAGAAGLRRLCSAVGTAGLRARRRGLRARGGRQSARWQNKKMWTPTLKT
jgi:hypothetical protein